MTWDGLGTPYAVDMPAANGPTKGIRCTACSLMRRKHR